MSNVDAPAARKQELPPVVYVPSQPMEPGETELNLELRYLSDGQIAVLAYTSLDRLVHAFGTAQPWALLYSEQVWELCDNGTVDVIAVDPEIPAELRRDERAAPGGSDGRPSQRDRWSIPPPSAPSDES